MNVISGYRVCWVTTSIKNTSNGWKTIGLKEEWAEVEDNNSPQQKSASRRFFLSFFLFFGPGVFEGHRPIKDHFILGAVLVQGEIAFAQELVSVVKTGIP